MMVGEEADRETFALVSPPPQLLRTSRTSTKTVAPVYTGRPETPLPAGEWHGFVLDRGSRFRIQAKWTEHHAHLVKGRPIAAAGQIFADQQGRLIEIDCQSRDYPLFVSGPDDRMVRYLMDAFESSPDFELAPSVTFVFDNPDRTQLRIARDGTERTQVALRIFDGPADSDGRQDAHPSPLGSQPPGGVQGDGLGKRRAL